MRKLKLNLDALKVESFGTDAARGGRGTVLARQITLDCNTDWSCDSRMQTCFDSCGGCPSWDLAC